jgi:hypothetical protein
MMSLYALILFIPLNRLEFARSCFSLGTSYVVLELFFGMRFVQYTLPFGSVNRVTWLQSMNFWCLVRPKFKQLLSSGC